MALVDDNYIRSSPITVGNTTVNNGKSRFFGMVLNTDGNNNAVILVYDGNGGSEIASLTCVGADISYGVILPLPIFCGTTLYVELTGANAKATIFWQPAS